jgi:hypothetical protein
MSELDVHVRDFQPGDRIRTGIGPATVESVKVGRVWATVRLVGKRVPMTLQVDETWTVRREDA